MAYAEKRGQGPKPWRVKYMTPAGERSESGFATKKAALMFGSEQESKIRRNEWIDPKDSRTTFGVFADLFMDAARLADSTRAKYDSFLKNHILPEWENWELGELMGAHLEITGWVKDLHEELMESSVASIFACFSTIMNAAVAARKIQASPCPHVKVTSGSYEAEHLVAEPVQAVQASIRLGEAGGLSDLVLCMMDFWTGARWSELVGQTHAEYDQLGKRIRIDDPLKETAGKLKKGGLAAGDAPPERAGRRPKKKGRTKTPAGTRWVKLPPFLALMYEMLLAEREGERYVFVGDKGGLLRRSNYRRRLWRPAWDGDPANPDPALRVAPILPYITFNEGRHTQRTWLAADGVPEVARAYRLGHKIKGMGSVYEHVTPEMDRQVMDCLTRRWVSALRELDESERKRLLVVAPFLAKEVDAAMKDARGSEHGKTISQIPPKRAAGGQ